MPVEAPVASFRTGYGAWTEKRLARRELLGVGDLSFVSPGAAYRQLNFGTSCRLGRRLASGMTVATRHRAVAMPQDG